MDYSRRENFDGSVIRCVTVLWLNNKFYSNKIIVAKRYLRQEKSAKKWIGSALRLKHDLQLSTPTPDSERHSRVRHRQTDGRNDGPTDRKTTVMPI